jgi:hypothetical protein
MPFKRKDQERHTPAAGDSHGRPVRELLLIYFPKTCLTWPIFS